MATIQSVPGGDAAANGAPPDFDASKLAAILDEFDRRDNQSAGVMLRRSTRYRYRGSTIVEIPGPITIRLTVTCRNISQLGIGFMMTRFVHPGTQCRVRLVSHLNHEAIVSARIVRCQYVSGTARVHEIGAEFDRPIDVELFCTNATRARVLLVDGDQHHAEVLCAILRSHGVRVDVSCSPTEAAKLPVNANFDVVVVARPSGAREPACCTRALRESGLVTPLVTVADCDQQPDDDGERCKTCQACRVLRLARNDLKQLVEYAHREPVTSTFACDPAMREAINTFVSQVHAWIADLRTAVNENDAAKTAGITRSLAVVAEGVGFELISEQAQAVAEILAQTKDVNAARQAISHLAMRTLAARPAVESATPDRSTSGRGA